MATWWDRMSPNQKKAYLLAHPKSKKAKGAGKKAIGGSKRGGSKTNAQRKLEHLEKVERRGPVLGAKKLYNRQMEELKSLRSKK